MHIARTRRAETSWLPLIRHRAAHTRPNPFYIPPPRPEDLPPISQRLKPIIPFVLYWTALTSLAYHLMRVKRQTEEDLSRRDAQVTVLERVVERYKEAYDKRVEVDEGEVERELRLVGLRAGASGDVVEGRKISWKEVLFGRKKAKLTEEEQEKAAQEEWIQVINKATEPAKPPTIPASTPAQDYSNLDSSIPQATSRRAPSSTVYM